MAGGANDEQFSQRLRELHDVLGLVRIQTFGPWWWRYEDLDEPTASGRIFRCYEPGNSQELAYLMVCDVSGDPDEPDVSRLTPELALEFDHRLEMHGREVMEASGRRLIRWMSSQLNTKDNIKGLVTAYIAEDDGRNRQYIDLRTRVDGKNIVVAGCFDVRRSDELAAPIFGALKNAEILNKFH